MRLEPVKGEGRPHLFRTDGVTLYVDEVSMGCVEAAISFLIRQLTHGGNTGRHYEYGGHYMILFRSVHLEQAVFNIDAVDNEYYDREDMKTLVRSLLERVDHV